MEFKEYSSIENSYRQKTIQHAFEQFPKMQYVVQEKVHGANFSFWYNHESKTLLCGKRSGFIPDGENFYNHTRVLTKYQDKLMELGQFLESDFVLYGEIYGGKYLHEDVPKFDIKSVQKEVQYCPDVDFIAFDMKYNDDFISPYWMNDTLDMFDIPRSPILMEGSLGDCLKYPNDFSSKIPQQLHNLPELESNITEGTVIKSVIPKRMHNGSRLVFKNKNEKFNEKSSEKKSPSLPREISELAASHIVAVAPYIVENRLRNVLSKIGEVTNKDFGKINGHFAKDIIEDYRKENESFEELNKEDRHRVTSFVLNETSGMIRTNLVNILDGAF